MAPSPRYSRYVLGVLLLGYIFNYLDRYILSILLPAIKQDLGLSDAMLGFLIGPAFAFVYATAGIPIARFADTHSRTAVIAIGMSFFSVFTALSGLVQSSFQLAVTRIAVGIGEAAGTAPSHSLISDYFPPEQRGRALAIFGTGIYFGMFVGLTLGGVLVEQIGWRWTFAAVGLPGIAVALLIRLTVREPERDPLAMASSDAPESLWDGIRFLWGMKAFRYAALGLGISSFGGAGFGMWVPTFFVRVHEMSPAQIGALFGTISPGSAFVATVAGGFLVDSLGKRDKRWWAWLPTLATLVSTPFLVLVLTWPEARQAVWWALPAGIGAMAAACVYTVIQNLAPPRLRALGASLLVLNTTILGLGAGPWAVGMLSDVLSEQYGAEAIRYALLIGLTTNPIGAFCFWLCGRSLLGDLETSARMSETGQASHGH